MFKKLNEFIKLEAFGGVVLFIATILALVFSNSSLSSMYESFFRSMISISFHGVGVSKPLILWINDGLMAIFFFLVVLELKQEFISGDLSNRSQIMFPAISALGGILIPALIYVLIIQDFSSNYIHGWSIPTATDIAFSLGVLSLFGKKVPYQLKVMLTAIAIFDDLASIVIIAIYYTDNLSLSMICWSLALIVVLFLLNRYKVNSLALYSFIGLALWVCVLKSGIHATLAGVILALFIPMENNKSMGNNIIRSLHPWVVYFIIPIFALANAGIKLNIIEHDILTNKIFLGVSLGLIFGKPIGIVGFAWLGEFFNIANRANQLSWRLILAVSFLCGIGFTMSLFLGTVAFNDHHLYNFVKLGVFLGSIIAGIIGSLLLKYAKV